MSRSAPPSGRRSTRSPRPWAPSRVDSKRGWRRLAASLAASVARPPQPVEEACELEAAARVARIQGEALRLVVRQAREQGKDRDSPPAASRPGQRQLEPEVDRSAAQVGQQGTRTGCAGAGADDDQFIPQPIGKE